MYVKRDSSGRRPCWPAADPGCPDPEGCYYTLNGLVERSSGAGDLPIQPYFVYDSRLSGTSQHGVLWKGGGFEEESGWVPVIGELVSNGGDGSNHGIDAADRDDQADRAAGGGRGGPGASAGRATWS